MGTDIIIVTFFDNYTNELQIWRLSDISSRDFDL